MCLTFFPKKQVCKQLFKRPAVPRHNGIIGLPNPGMFQEKILTLNEGEVKYLSFPSFQQSSTTLLLWRSCVHKIFWTNYLFSFPLCLLKILQIPLPIFRNNPKEFEWYLNNLDLWFKFLVVPIDESRLS